MKVIALILSMLLVCAAAQGDDEVKLDTSTVTGNRELPKVMVIVPWKKAAPGDVPGRPVDSLLDESLEPVGRATFRRELANYRDHQAAAPKHEAKEE